MIVGVVGAGALFFAFLLTPAGQQFGQYLPTRTLGGFGGDNLGECNLKCPDGRTVQQCIVTEVNKSGVTFTDYFYFRDPCGKYAGQCVYDTCGPGMLCGAPQVVDCASSLCNSGPCKAPEPSPRADTIAPAVCGADPCREFGPSCNSPIQEVACTDPRCNAGPCQNPTTTTTSGGGLIQRSTSFPNPFPGRQLPTFPPTSTGSGSSGTQPQSTTTVKEPLSCPEGEVIVCPGCAAGTPPEQCACRCTSSGSDPAPVPTVEKKEPVTTILPNRLPPEVGEGGERTSDPTSRVFGDGWQKVVGAFRGLSGLIGQGLTLLSELLFERE